MDILFKQTNNTTSFLDFQTPGWILSLLVALPENSYVIWLIVTGAGNGVAAEFFSLNLSVCEIFFCLQSFFSLMSRHFQGVWFIVGFLSGFSVTGHPLFQCLMCVERYLAVVHPVTFLKYKPLRYKVICSTVAWIIIFMSCVFYSVSDAFVHVVVLVSGSAHFFYHVVLLCGCSQSSETVRTRRKKEEENHMKRRAFNIIVKIIMAMLLINASYFFTALSYLLSHKHIAELWSVGQVCFLLGGLVQPLLYLHRRKTTFL